MRKGCEQDVPLIDVYCGALDVTFAWTLIIVGWRKKNDRNLIVHTIQKTVHRFRIGYHTIM